MPFTPGHAAIVLPFIRSRYFSATGLIIGSQSPDFEYFFKMSVNSVHSHTKAGLFYFDLPVTLLLALIFHQVVKYNFIRNLPPFLQRRFQDTLHFNFVQFLRKHWAIFLISSLIGAASHIFWDSFTHNNRFFVRLFSDFYQSYSVPFDGANYPMFYVLQQVSTAVGLAIVILYILLKKPVANATISAPTLKYWLIVFGVAIVVLRIRFWVYMDDYDLGNVVVTSLAGLMIGVICCGFITFKSTLSGKGLNG